jgi:hypothetical protein
MLYKESAIAVMVAAMLGVASLFGGFSIVPAIATHDPEAVQLANHEVSQDANESTIIDSVELTAKKSFTKARGTVTVEVIQGDEVLRSGTLSSSEIDTSFSDIEVDLANVNVTGSFEVLVEYIGGGTLTVSRVDVIEGTETAEEPADDEEAPPNTEEPDNSPPPQDQELENVIATRDISLDDEETMTIDIVELTAKKSFTKARGTLTVAIVQDGKIIETDTISSEDIGTFDTDLEISFDKLNVTNDFEVAIMYDGRGIVTANSIVVVGETDISEDNGEPTDNEPPAPGTLHLTVNAIDQNGNAVSDMWVAVLQGMTLVESGFTEEVFTLETGKTYTVEMGDWFDETSGTSYDFNGWSDSVQDNRRTAELNENEEYTAKYIVTTGASPPPPPDTNPDDPPTNPPPASGPGTITAIAQRIPSPYWGPTFTSANAQMYFVLYNSTGYIVYTGFFDENGNTVTGLNNGETYWIYPTDCDECHDDPHDVVFDHWQDGSSERPRAVMPGTSVTANYMFDPDP